MPTKAWTELLALVDGGGDTITVPLKNQPCTATTRAGNPCKATAVPFTGKCRMHGGTSQVALSGAREKYAEVEKLVLEDFVDDAIRTVRDIMKDETADDKIRLAAARDILDRCGFKPVQRNVNVNVDVDFTNVDDEIETMLAKRAELRQQGDVIDITPVDEPKSLPA